MWWPNGCEMLRGVITQRKATLKHLQDLDAKRHTQRRHFNQNTLLLSLHATLLVAGIILQRQPDSKLPGDTQAATQIFHNVSYVAPVFNASHVPSGQPFPWPPLHFWQSAALQHAWQAVRPLAPHFIKVCRQTASVVEASAVLNAAYSGVAAFGLLAVAIALGTPTQAP